jgi:hypothetical protein
MPPVPAVRGSQVVSALEKADSSSAGSTAVTTSCAIRDDRRKRKLSRSPTSPGLLRRVLQRLDHPNGGRAARHDESVALQLASEEPEAGPWRVELLRTVVNAVTRRRPDQGSSGRPAVLAIDGRSNNGKTTLADRIRELVPGSVVIHTDDIAWAHSRFGWADLLIDGILVPVHHGQPVSYRPPRWDEHGREGSIEVPAGCPLLIIEGDGAGRRESRA